MTTEALLLRVALTHFITAPTAELAQAEIERLAARPLPDFADAIAELLRQSLIRDPIRLEPQALQCHWRLELTPTGVARARTLTGA
jgi:hypothetical protein